MKKTNLITKLRFLEITKKVFKQHHVNTVFDNSVQKDNGWLIGNEIHLSLNGYTSIPIMIAIWCHEFGHYIIWKSKSKANDVKSTFQCEFKAWEIGQRTHVELFGRPFSKTQGNFCLKCLKTYSKSHYDFTHLAYDKAD